MALFVMAMVVGCGGGGGNSQNSSSTTPAASPPSAEMTGISPVSVTVGSPAFTLVVSGKNFTASTAITVDGVVRNNAVVVDSSTINVPMSAADVATVGVKAIGIGDVAAPFEVKGKPWVTAENCPAQNMVKAADGLLYASYAKDGDAFLCRFDANGNKVPIANKNDVAIAATNRNEYSEGITVFGGNAYVVVLREYPSTMDRGEGYLEKINLTTGQVKEDIIMMGGQLTGFATDNIGAIYIAFNFNGQLGEYKSAVVGINAADATVIFEQGWMNSPRISAVAVDTNGVYLGGVITNATGGQARMYVRKVNRATGAFIWEDQMTEIARSVNDDTLYPGSFALDSANDALYFSGAMDYFTPDGASGALARVRASTGDFVWAHAAPIAMDYAFAPLLVDGGDLYGENYFLDSTVRIDPATGTTFMWKHTKAMYPIAIYVADGIVYLGDISGKIFREAKANGAIIN